MDFEDEELTEEEMQEFKEQLRLEEERRLQAEELLAQREQEQWKFLREMPPNIPRCPCTVRPIYHRRLERGRNGSYLERRG